MIWEEDPGENTGTEHKRYLHPDRQGTPVRMTDAGQNAVEFQSLNSWGSRISTAWSYVGGQSIPQDTRVGYTGHEADDEFGRGYDSLINMDGREYDPMMKRFLSADPTVQSPLSGQSWNRYSYAGNNPVRYTDPTGYDKEYPEEWSPGDQSGGGDDFTDDFGNPSEGDFSQGFSYPQQQPQSTRIEHIRDKAQHPDAGRGLQGTSNEALAICEQRSGTAGSMAT